MPNGQVEMVVHSPPFPMETSCPVSPPLFDNPVPAMDPVTSMNEPEVEMVPATPPPADDNPEHEEPPTALNTNELLTEDFSNMERVHEILDGLMDIPPHLVRRLLESSHNKIPIISSLIPRLPPAQALQFLSEPAIRGKWKFPIWNYAQLLARNPNPQYLDALQLTPLTLPVGGD